jgi:hypothetical protein
MNVPPWEDLYELSREELRLTNLVTTDMIAQQGSPNAAVVELTPKSMQNRFISSALAVETNPEPAKSTKSVGPMGRAGGPAAGPMDAPPWNQLLDAASGGNCRGPFAAAGSGGRRRQSKHPKPPYKSPIPFDVAPYPTYN